MSIYAQTNIGQTQVASNKGWGQFGDWAETLDAKEFLAIVTLWEHGITEPSARLSAELEAAKAKTKPIVDVEGIIDNLVEACKDASYLLVSNGVSNTSDEDETKSINAADELPAWTPEELDAMSEEFTEDDLKRALATSSEPLREMLRAKDSE